MMNCQDLKEQKTSNGIAKVNYSSKDAFNPEMLKNSDIKVDRTSEKYSQLRRLLLDLKREHSAWYKKVKDEVQKYIRNKNQYLQKLIDEKKAQSYMAFSEKEWVARLESQLRDESVFLQAKLESDCEFESNIWGEPNPLDIFIEEAV